MAYEIIYVCNSINNKNVREGELNILRAYPEKLYFEFGENEMNVKKRFYDDIETMNIDFEALEKLAEAIKKAGVSVEELEKVAEPFKIYATEEEPNLESNIYEHKTIRKNKKRKTF